MPDRDVKMIKDFGKNASDAPKPEGKGSPTFFALSQITKLAGFDGNAKKSVLNDINLSKLNYSFWQGSIKGKKRI